MSVFYRKVNVLAASNGALKQSGILLMDQANNFAYVSAGTNIPELAAGAAMVNTIGRLFSISFAGAASGACVRTSCPTSFASFVRSAAEHISAFSSFVLHLSGDAVEVQSGTVLDLNSICGVEAAGENGSAETVAMKSGYATHDIYQGLGSYHSNQSHHRFNEPLIADKPWRIGVELEVYARSHAARQTILNARSNWFQCETDSSLRDAAFGGSDMAIELKTVPLRACDATSVDFWAGPMDRLRELARSKGSTTTGLHVHIGKEILGDTETERQKTLAKLSLFYVYMVEDDPDAHRKNVIICGREQGYAGSLAQAKSPMADQMKRFGCLDKVNEVGQRAIGGELRKDGHRWDINTGTYDRYGTIEFRKADGRISKTRMAAVVTWWEQMVLYCKATPWNELNFNSFFRKVTSENPCVAYFFTQDEEA